MKKYIVEDYTIGHTVPAQHIEDKHDGDLEDFLRYFFSGMEGTGGWDAILEAISDVCIAAKGIRNYGIIVNETLGIEVDVFTD